MFAIEYLFSMKTANELERDKKKVICRLPLMCTALKLGYWQGVFLEETATLKKSLATQGVINLEDDLKKAQQKVGDFFGASDRSPHNLLQLIDKCPINNCVDKQQQMIGTIKKEISELGCQTYQNFKSRAAAHAYLRNGCLIFTGLTIALLLRLGQQGLIRPAYRKWFAALPIGTLLYAGINHLWALYYTEEVDSIHPHINY